MTKGKSARPGVDTHHGTRPIGEDRDTEPRPVRVGYRSFDRQWVLPDARVMDMPRRDLWAARVPGPVFVVEQHRHPFQSGPALLFSPLIPDFDHFNNRGGRTFPYRHPDGTANWAPGLTTALSVLLGVDVALDDVFAYVARADRSPRLHQNFH